MAQVEAEVRAVQEECSNMDETECPKRASWRLIQLLSLAPSLSLSPSLYLSLSLSPSLGKFDVSVTFKIFLILKFSLSLVTEAMVHIHTRVLEGYLALQPQLFKVNDEVHPRKSDEIRAELPSMPQC